MIAEGGGRVVAAFVAVEGWAPDFGGVVSPPMPQRRVVDGAPGDGAPGAYHDMQSMDSLVCSVNEIPLFS